MLTRAKIYVDENDVTNTYDYHRNIYIHNYLWLQVK